MQCVGHVRHPALALPHRRGRYRPTDTGAENCWPCGDRAFSGQMCYSMRTHARHTSYPDRCRGHTAWRGNSHDGSAQNAPHSARPHCDSHRCSKPFSIGCGTSYAAVSAPATLAACPTLSSYTLSMRIKRALPARYAICYIKSSSVWPCPLGDGYGISRSQRRAKRTPKRSQGTCRRSGADGDWPLRSDVVHDGMP